MALGREYRVILWLMAGLGIFVVAGYLRYWTAPETRRLDTRATRKIIEFCGYRAECKVRLGDLFDGDWDRLYLLGSGVGQAGADDLLGRGQVRVQPGRRTLVLMRGSTLVASEPEGTGGEMPANGEIEFLDERHREQRIVRGRREDWLWANRFECPGGGYYVLSPDDR